MQNSISLCYIKSNIWWHSSTNQVSHSQYDDGVIVTLLKQSISASSILRVEPKNKGGDQAKRVITDGGGGASTRNMAPNNGAGVTKNNTNWEQHSYTREAASMTRVAAAIYGVLYYSERSALLSFFGTPWSVKTEKWLLLQRVQTRWDINGTKWLSWQFLNQNCILKS